MKEMNKIEKYTDKEWEELSSLLSEEQNDNKDLLSRFMAEDRHNTIKYWKELKEMNSDKEINVDKAWNKLHSRLSENGLIAEAPVVRRSFVRTAYFRIAAIVILLLGIGSVLLYMNDKGALSRKTIVATTDNQKNLQVTLPDGSNIFLNRNTRLSYRENFGRNGRNVTLSGEAFFEIARDENKPFTVDAGKASVKVLGTSFNIITSNPDSAVEVFVKTGQVMVSGNENKNNLILDPGYIGTMSPERSEKSVNTDPNYMSWNTGLLVYDGQTLDVVFRDLKKVYNMDIVADDPGILENTWKTDPIDNQPQEIIIRLICLSFNLSYAKDGNVYHLAKK
ncbi:MAG: FecR domain-containing protein [Bacteroidia bacterium]|nr:FecR domain-containing protein [Bacteroidia bacterium]